jgi:uncharacterized DUF497 family protein
VLIFEWDAEKARGNEQKHGVTFLEASEVFDDDRSSTVRDQITQPMRSGTSSSALTNRAGTSLCPILSGAIESD